MARHKHYDYRKTKMMPISFDRQILQGTFEYTQNEVIDQHVDLSVFEANIVSGAPAYDSAILLKVILFAYLSGNPLIEAELYPSDLLTSLLLSAERNALTPPQLSKLFEFCASSVAAAQSISEIVVPAGSEFVSVYAASNKTMCRRGETPALLVGLLAPRGSSSLGPTTAWALN